MNSAELKKLSNDQIGDLCLQMRRKILSAVSANGGHLASNLGDVELITVLHKVFSIPEDVLLFDVGHQSYVHKMLTGREMQFFTLRQFGGLSGFPNPKESPCDITFAGHTGSALPTALGIAMAREENHVPGKVIAFLGDASLNNGLTLEALNCIRGRGKNLVIVLNDNKMSISPNVGGFSRHLNRLISWRYYNKFRYFIREKLMKTPRRKPFFRLALRIESALKSFFLPPAAVFQEFGLRYFGPVNGHSIADLTRVFELAKHLESPVLVHVVTHKGKGYDPAEKDPSLYHGVSPFDPEKGVVPGCKETFSSAFGKAMVALGEKHPELDAVSAAMIDGTGLSDFQKKFPERCHDTGIAEGCAVTYSAGLALAARHPVCFLYSTFAQRAFDNFYHDIFLPQLPVTLVLDRAGAVEDGPTHHGIYDLSFCRALPGVEILAPRCPAEAMSMLEYAIGKQTPVIIRYPRGGAPCETPPAPIEKGKAECLLSGSGKIVLWTMGAEAATGLKAAELLEKKLGRSGLVTVVNARFLAPFDSALARETGKDALVISVEDHVTAGGLASLLTETLEDVPHSALHFGWDHRIPLSHGKVADLKEKSGLTAEKIADAVFEKLIQDGKIL